LKRNIEEGHVTAIKSPPARGRGLKLCADGASEDLTRRPPRGGVD